MRNNITNLLSGVIPVTGGQGLFHFAFVSVLMRLLIINVPVRTPVDYETDYGDASC